MLLIRTGTFARTVLLESLTVLIAVQASFLLISQSGAFVFPTFLRIAFDSNKVPSSGRHQCRRLLSAGSIQRVSWKSSLTLNFQDRLVKHFGCTADTYLVSACICKKLKIWKWTPRLARDAKQAAHWRLIGSLRAAKWSKNWKVALWQAQKLHNKFLTEQFFKTFFVSKLRNSKVLSWKTYKSKAFYETLRLKGETKSEAETKEPLEKEFFSKIYWSSDSSKLLILLFSSFLNSSSCSSRDFAGQFALPVQHQAALLFFSRNFQIDTDNSWTRAPPNLFDCIENFMRF